MESTTVAVDLAKSVFEVAVANAPGPRAVDDDAHGTHQCPAGSAAGAWPESAGRCADSRAGGSSAAGVGDGVARCVAARAGQRAGGDPGRWRTASPSSTANCGSWPPLTRSARCCRPCPVWTVGGDHPGRPVGHIHAFGRGRQFASWVGFDAARVLERRPPATRTHQQTRRPLPAVPADPRLPLISTTYPFTKTGVRICPTGRGCCSTTTQVHRAPSNREEGSQPRRDAGHRLTTTRRTPGTSATRDGFRRSFFRRRLLRSCGVRLARRVQRGNEKTPNFVSLVRTAVTRT